MTAKTFERGEVVEIKGAWRGAPWRPGKYLCLAGEETHAVADNGGVTHYVSPNRIRKRSVTK